MFLSLIQVFGLCYFGLFGKYEAAPGTPALPPVTKLAENPSYTLELLSTPDKLSNSYTGPFIGPKPGREILNIQLGTRSSHHLNLTRLSEILTPQLIEKLWEEANVTEKLFNTLIKHNHIYKTEHHAIVIPGTGSPDYKCVVPSSQKLLNGSTDYNIALQVTGYLGEFGIPSKKILNEIFYYTSDVIKPMPSYHEIFYSLRTQCVYISLSFIDGNYQLAGFLTRDFTFLTLIRTETSGVTHSLTLLFGLSNKLPTLKGFLVYKDVVVANNDIFSLAVLSTFEDYSHITNYFHPNYTDLFIQVTEVPLNILIKNLQDEMMKIEVDGGCKVPALDANFIGFVLKVLIAHFMTTSGITDSGTHVQFTCLSSYMSELEFLRDMMFACFPTMYFKGFTSGTVAKVAASLTLNTPIKNIPQKSSQQNTILDMFRLGRDVVVISNKTLWGSAVITDKIYTRFAHNFSLTDTERMLLLKVYSVTTSPKPTSKDIDNKNLMLTYVLATSMCNSLEIATIISRVIKSPIHDIYKTFSPCYMSLRFDFTQEKLASEGMQTSELTSSDNKLGALGMLNVIKRRHVTTSAGVVSISKCFKENNTNILLIIPLYNITYLVSTKPILNAINYDVAETYLKSSMVISAVNPNCVPLSNAKLDPIPIPVVYNMSTPKSVCLLCGSVVLSYDERDGIQSIMYVTNMVVQNSLFLPNSPFFETQNMHTHYLLMFNNGTIVEVRGMYRQRATSVIIFVMFFIGFCAGIYCVYKIFSKLC